MVLGYALPVLRPVSGITLGLAAPVGLVIFGLFLTDTRPICLVVLGVEFGYARFALRIEPVPCGLLPMEPVHRFNRPAFSALLVHIPSKWA